MDSVAIVTLLIFRIVEPLWRKTADVEWDDDELGSSGQVIKKPGIIRHVNWHIGWH